jgi:hypothetical protein
MTRFISFHKLYDGFTKLPATAKKCTAASKLTGNIKGILPEMAVSLLWL